MIIISVEGGVVQSISSDDPEVVQYLNRQGVVIVDYDTEGFNDSDLMAIKYIDESGLPEYRASVGEIPAERTVVDCEDLRRKINGDN